jgi:hypothetical protein
LDKNEPGDTEVLKNLENCINSFEETIQKRIKNDNLFPDQGVFKNSDRQ